MSACPNCGHVLAPAEPTVHRGELERQVGDVAIALQLRVAAEEDPHAAPRRLWMGFIAWRGYVWTRCRTRKAATCVYSGAALPAGAWAWRQLSEVRDRKLRVSADAWAHL